MGVEGRVNLKSGVRDERVLGWEKWVFGRGWRGGRKIDVGG